MNRSSLGFFSSDESFATLFIDVRFVVNTLTFKPQE